MPRLPSQHSETTPPVAVASVNIAPPPLPEQAPTDAKQAGAGSLDDETIHECAFCFHDVRTRASGLTSQSTLVYMQKTHSLLMFLILR